MEKFKIDHVNRWLTLGANVGVVFGLLLLIMELRQNAELTRVSMEQSMNDLIAEVEFSLADPIQADAWVRSYLAPETLTDVDIRMVEAHLVALMMQWDYLFEMEKSGLANPDRIEQHIQNSAKFYFGSRFAKAWFRAEAPGWEGTRMMEVAGPIVEALDDDFMKNHYRQFRPESWMETAPAE